MKFLSILMLICMISLKFDNIIYNIAEIILG